MPTPRLHKRGDIVVMVALDPTASPTSPTYYTNFCGATGISLNIENSISETNVGDCEDWTLPIQTVLDYGAQTVGMTINAQLARSNRDKLLRWAKDQLILPVRTFFVDAAPGEVEYVDGMGMLPTLNIENIGSTEQNAVVTTTLNLRFQEGVEFTDAT